MREIEIEDNVWKRKKKTLTFPMSTGRIAEFVT